jgi:FkbM family methyltransferase
MIYYKLINLIRSRFFPSKHQLTASRYFADGGDYKFRFDYDLNHNSIVLDLGGYEGQWTSDIFSRFKCNVFVFEPVAEFADLIRARFRRNDQIKVFEFGLGNSQRQEIIYLSANGSSLFGSKELRQDIEIVDVSDWLTMTGISKIDLLKLNIEGGEFELLDRLLEIDFVARIENIQVQFHNVEEESYVKMERIKRELSRTHYSTYQYEWVWENWTRKK